MRGKIFGKRVAAALAATILGSSLASSPAFATEFFFDLTKTSTVNNAQYNQVYSETNAGSIGNLMDYTTTAKSNSTSLSVRISGWSIDTGSLSNTPGFTSGNVYDATLEHWYDNSGNGLGIGLKNQWEADNVPQHSIDNDNGIDFVILQFSKPVDLNSISIGWVYTGQGVNTDADATIEWGPGPSGAWNVSPIKNSSNTPIDNNSVSVLNSLITNENSVYNLPGSTTGTRQVQTNVMSDFWIISAASPNPNNDGQWKNQTYNDYFKLSAISVNDTPPVPEPATWMTMIAGFGMIGGVMRRRSAPAGDLAAAGL